MMPDHQKIQDENTELFLGSGVEGTETVTPASFHAELTTANSETDGKIYKRIICSSDSSGSEDQDDGYNDPMKNLLGTQALEDMDNFITGQLSVVETNGG